ncbi:hypothetical protein HY78_25080 [Rhizorhabdus wittichii DC-6]|nr:hypothetical protein HY78_25080 [Rhizorhabdus wittichii DC-6]
MDCRCITKAVSFGKRDACLMGQRLGEDCLRDPPLDAKKMWLRNGDHPKASFAIKRGTLLNAKETIWIRFIASNHRAKLKIFAPGEAR